MCDYSGSTDCGGDMKVLMFQNGFAEMVKNGTKKQTIRRLGKREIKAGDILSLRRWTGKPYRSKQEVLKETKCFASAQITIFTDEVLLTFLGFDIDVKKEHLAQMDGFSSWSDMLTWFKKTHGLPFEGNLIRWE